MKTLDRSLFLHVRPPSAVVGRFVVFTAIAVAVSLLLLVDLSQPVRSAAGVVVLVGGVLAALQYLRRSLRRVEQQGELYEKVLGAVPCYVLILDRKYEVLWTNSLFQQHFGRGTGLRCHELYRGLDSPCSECTAQETFEKGEVFSAEQSLTTNDGETIDVLVDSAPITNDQGDVVAVLEIAVDITSVKEMQQQLGLLGQTVAGMAHSIKNIMMGLDGGIYVVNRGLEARDQAEIEEGWEMVQLNFEKISKLVRDILYCSKEREPNLQKVDPNKVLKEVYDLYMENAKSYQIDLEIETDDSLNEAVMDPDGLHTVISNLVVNAIDACKVDLWKDSHVVAMKSRKGPDGTTVVEVSDNGVGMEQEFKDRAFEEFFSTKGNQGTGLGLMVTQKIMREHGGNISFNSAPGKGTAFTVVFPPRELPANA